MITKPMLPPKPGYVEVEVNGERAYRNVHTGVLIDDEVHYVAPPDEDEPSIWDELNTAYQEGVDSI